MVTTFHSFTFLLFLKIAEAQTRPPFNKASASPKSYYWPSLLDVESDALENPPPMTASQPARARILDSRTFNTAVSGESFRKANAKSSTKGCAESSGIGRFVGARIFLSHGFSARTPLISRTASLLDAWSPAFKIVIQPLCEKDVGSAIYAKLFIDVLEDDERIKQAKQKEAQPSDSGERERENAADSSPQRTLHDHD
jgi:hypothetical protein